MAVEPTEKQRQFNAAMQRYTSHAGYVWFSHGVATANVALQAWLLWLVWPNSIGVGGQLLALIIAWLLADFVNGLVHMYMDDNDYYGSIVGPLVANFHLHHKTPLYRKRHLPLVYFVETGAKVWLVPCLAVIVLLTQVDGISPLLLHILVYFGIFSSVAEVSHYLCHTSNARIVTVLGTCRILLGKRHHAAHHLRDNVSYAFLNGLSDPLLNRIAACCSRGYRQHTDLHYATWQVDDESR